MGTCILKPTSPPLCAMNVQSELVKFAAFAEGSNPVALRARQSSALCQDYIPRERVDLVGHSLCNIAQLTTQ